MELHQIILLNQLLPKLLLQILEETKIPLQENKTQNKVITRVPVMVLDIHNLEWIIDHSCLHLLWDPLIHITKDLCFKVIKEEIFTIIIKGRLNTNITTIKGETTHIQTKVSLDHKHIIIIDQAFKIKIIFKTILGPLSLDLVLRNYVSCFKTQECSTWAF